MLQRDTSLTFIVQLTLYYYNGLTLTTRSVGSQDGQEVSQVFCLINECVLLRAGNATNLLTDYTLLSTSSVPHQRHYFSRDKYTGNIGN